VTDSFKVTLRTGPSSENKIIAMPSSGQPVKVLDSRGNWSHLRLLAMVWTTKRATAGAQWRKIKRSNASRKGRPIDFGNRSERGPKVRQGKRGFAVFPKEQMVRDRCTGFTLWVDDRLRDGTAKKETLLIHIFLKIIPPQAQNPPYLHPALRVQ